MKAKIKIIAIVCMAASILMTSCGASEKKPGEKTKEEHADEIVFTQKQANEAGIKLETVFPGDFTNVIKVSGQIQAKFGNEQTVVATASGIVSFSNYVVTDGAAIRAGQSVVVISAKKLQDGDPTQKAKAAYETAERELRRSEELVADKIISAKDFEQVKLRYETAKATWLGQAANVTAHGVSVAAPISGFIKNRLVKQGDYVAVGDPILTVTQNRRLQLRAEVPENSYKYLKNVSSANFKPAYDNNVYKLSNLNGRLLSYGKAADTESFYLPITFEFDNVGDFVAGAYAEVYLLAQPKKNVLSIPITALTEEQGIYYVYVQAKNEKEAFLKKEVTTGQDNGDRIEITKGLNAGDIVVVKGAYQVKLAASGAAVPEGHSH